MGRDPVVLDSSFPERGVAGEKFLTWGVVAIPVFCALFQGGYSVWVGLLAAAAAWILLGTLLLFAPREGAPPLVWHREDAVLLLAVAWAGFGLLGGPGEAVEGFLILLGGAASFLLARSLSWHGAGRRIARRLVFAGGIIALGAFLQVVGILPHDWWDPSRYPAGPFINHSHFAAFLNLLIPLAGGVLLSTRPGSQQRFGVLVSILAMAVGLVLSGSRGGWLSLVFASGVLCLLWSVRHRVSPNGVHALAGLAALGAVWFLVSRTNALDRVLTLGALSADQSAGSRAAIWSGTFRLVWDHPWVGSGLGTFVHLFPRYRPPGFYMQANHAHNDVLELAVELGGVGLVLAAGVALVLLRRGFRMAGRTGSPWKRSLGWGCMAGLAALTLHGLVDFPWRVPGVFYLASVVAGIFAGLRYGADPDPLCAFPPREEPKGARGFLLPIRVTAVMAALGVAGASGWSLAADLQYRRGMEAEGLRRWEEATLLYGRALDRAPWRMDVLRRSADLWALRAESMDGYGRREARTASVEAYRSLLGRVPYDSVAMDGLSRVLRRMGQVDEAIPWMERAVRGDPNNPVLWKRWAEIKTIQGKAKEGAAGFARAVALSEPYGFFPSIFGNLSDPAVWMERGEIALLRGQLSIARNYFEVARELGPGRMEPLAGLALCALYRDGETSGLTESAGLSSAPARALWFSGRGYYLLKKGRWEEAETAARDALEADPENLLAAQTFPLLASRQGADASRAAGDLIRSNRPPVFARQDPESRVIAVWEPEKGIYPEGSRISNGWALYRKGAIRQRIRLPAGKARVEVIASGSKFRGTGPQMTVSWNGVPAISAEVGEVWTAYGGKIQIDPGEAWLSIEFMNDSANPLTREDRNLKVDKVIVRWEGA